MRLLHTMLRVGNLDASIAFYTEVLGMQLSHNWGVEKYDLGDGYGHIALEVEDVYKACEDIRARGGKITREPGPMMHGSSILAFVEDPDGYKIELLSPKRAD